MIETDKETEYQDRLNGSFNTVQDDEETRSQKLRIRNDSFYGK